VKIRVPRTGERWVREDRYRQAEVSFITDAEKRSPEYFWSQFCEAAGIPLSDFVVRTRKTKWLQRRDQYWDSVTQEVLRRSKYRAVHDRVKELEQLQQVRSNVLELLQPEIISGRKIYRVAPSTQEGMIGALVKLDQRADDKRDAVLTMIEPDLQREIKGEQSTVFAADEMREVARMLLKARRDRQQRLLAAKRPPIEIEDKDADE
jgi:hypothetical protein